MRYKPFGEQRYTSATPPTDLRFTGQRLENGLDGIYDFKARFFDPAVGRFLAPDSIIPGAGNPMAWDRYSYTQNNPIRYSDPTGHMVACGTDAGNGCAGTGLGDLTPSEIINAEDDPYLQTMAVYNYSVTHPDYNYVLDTKLEDTGKVIVANAIFLGNADAVRRKPNIVDRIKASGPAFASGASLAMAGIVAGGQLRGEFVCPNCGKENPTLLRSTGNIVNDTVASENIGRDGLSVYCQSCGQNLRSGNTYRPVTVEQVRSFSLENNLNVDAAAVYTPEFGGEGHYSLFTDAYGPDGRFLPGIGEKIDAFFRSIPKIKWP